MAFCVHCRCLLGELVGYNVAIATFRATLGTVVNQAGVAQTLLKWAIAAYLVFLAIRLWRFSPTDGASAFTIRRVFLTTLLNPKGLIFALFIFPPQPTPIAVYTAAFSMMVVAVGTLWIVAGSLITQLTRARYTFVAPRICALALAVFAVVVASGFLR